MFVSVRPEREHQKNKKVQKNSKFKIDNDNKKKKIIRLIITLKE